MKLKIFFVLSAVVLMSASCSLFGQAVVSGVVKSVNGGADWQFTNTVSNIKNGTLSGLNVSKMVFDPANRQTVFVGGYNGGLYKSTDAGLTWNNILTNIDVYDIAINPVDSKTIYAAGLFASHGRVVVTHDGGGSWQQIFDEGSESNAVRQVALNPADPQEVLIGTQAGTLIKSEDGGISWRLIKDFQDRISEIVWRPAAAYMLLQTKGLFQSTDRGESFNAINGSLTSAGSFIALPNSTVQNIVGNFNQFYVDIVSPALIYMTTDKGLYKTVDGGKTWSNLALPIKGTDSAARGIAIAQGSSNIVYVSISSTVYKSVDAGQTWQTQRVATGGFINYILIDPQLPQIVYAGIYGSD
jgi:photosystem II stability/assembly factor-like uncharacterized protein